MDTKNILTGIKTEDVKYPTPQPKPRVIPTPIRVPQMDALDIGQNPAQAAENAPSIVLERAIMRIRATVEQASAELRLPEGAQLDTSAEATAGRIADFALGLYDKWRQRNADLSETDARSNFAALIGNAVAQGVNEAREILGALQALSPEVDQKVNAIAEMTQQRIEQFAANA